MTRDTLGASGHIGCCGVLGSLDYAPGSTFVI